jgi:hypothetical protein
MRWVVACAIVLLFLVAVTVATLDYARVRTEAASTAAQVTLEGVPVCVFRHAGQVVAGIGRCGIEVPVPGLPADDRALPPPGEIVPPDLALPPGHPPLDGNGGTRDGRVLI